MSGQDHSRRGHRDEGGSGTLLVVGVLAVVLALGFAAMLVAGYLLAVHRARAAADLAALSGATAIAQGRDGCGQARQLAAANQAAVLSCARVGDQTDFVLTVRVSVPAPATLPGLPTSIAALAHAGPAPDR